MGANKIQDIEEMELKKFKIDTIMPDSTILILGRRRSGKSSAKGEHIMMWNGEIKKVEDIKVGDLVMGDDSTPRTVLETHSGTDQLYKVTNMRGESYTVNSHHILSLMYSRKKEFKDRKEKSSFQIVWFNKNRCKNNHKTFSYKNKDKEEVRKEAMQFLENVVDDRIIDIPIKEYLNLSKHYKEFLLGYQVPINFPEKQLPIDPYMIGYWLGDGSSANSNITTQDSTVLYYFAKNVSKYNLFLEYKLKYTYKISSEYGQKNNFFLQTLKDLNLINNKHIPMIYKCNSKENRLKLLAGFIDADGHLGKRNEFEITQCKEHEKLMDDIIYLARSLGFSATKHVKNTTWTYKGEKKYGTALRININGQGIEEIPTKIPRKQARPRKNRVNTLVSRIKITDVGHGEYYGIELDGNNRYVLGNFIVTHNSFLLRDILYHHRSIPAGVVFSGTEQASPFFSEFIPDSYIHPTYNPELMDQLMIRQRKKIRESKARGIGINGKHKDNNFFIVLDDMLHEAQMWKKDETIKSIFFNGRHYNFMFFLTMQYPIGIPPDLRSNIDYVFIFNEPSLKNRKNIYENYASVIPSFEHFCNILDKCTQNHECLVIKLSGHGIEDQVFWYKAKIHENFKVGDKKFWDYHYKNYNPNYEMIADKQAEKTHELKKKFKNTKKLKVIVSKTTGNIENHYTETD